MTTLNGNGHAVGGYEPVKFLVFSASLRAESFNTHLARLVQDAVTRHGGTVDFAAMADFDSPSFNQDVEQTGDFPAGARALRRRIEANDAFVIVSPEYNASMPGVLKNVIDWVSRFSPQPFNARHALLLSASPSLIGGNRGLWALRIPLEQLGARVFPDMYSLAQVHQAFDAAGQIADPLLRERFDSTIVAFMELVEAAKHYPCAKQAWVEFLGEHPTAATARVE